MVKTFVFSASWWNGETPRDLRFSMEKLRNGVKLELYFMKRKKNKILFKYALCITSSSEHSNYHIYQFTQSTNHYQYDG